MSRERCAAVSALVLAACASTAKRAPDAPRAGPLEVVASTADENASRFDVGRRSIDAAKLAADVRDLLAKGRNAQAERLVRRFPEVARQVERTPANAELVLVLERAERAVGGVAAARSDTAASAEAWRAAVLQAAPRVDPALGWCEPALWERAAQDRRVDEAWPAQVHGALAHAANAHLDAGLEAPERSIPPDGAAWIVIGAQRVQRGELEAALVAISRARGLCDDARTRALVEIEQAACLAQLERKDVARTILLRWCEDADPRVARAALAWLGLLEVELERASEGKILLARALALAPEVPWAQRARCQANLGLALLLLGEEDAGLRELRAAQARFESERRIEEWVQSLRNELAYYRAAGDTARIEESRARLALVERL